VTGIPAPGRDIAIDQDAAQRYGLRLGDLLRVAGEARTGTFTLSHPPVRQERQLAA